MKMESKSEPKLRESSLRIGCFLLKPTHSRSRLKRISRNPPPAEDTQETLQSAMPRQLFPFIRCEIPPPPEDWCIPGRIAVTLSRMFTSAAVIQDLRWIEWNKLAGNSEARPACSNPSLLQDHRATPIYKETSYNLPALLTRNTCGPIVWGT